MTADEDRCALTELPKTGCAHCLNHADPVTPDDLGPGDLGVPFVGRFDGHCAVCGTRTAAGEVIAKLTDGSGYSCSKHLS